MRNVLLEDVKGGKEYRFTADKVPPGAEMIPLLKKSIFEKFGSRLAVQNAPSVDLFILGYNNPVIEVGDSNNYPTLRTQYTLMNVGITVEGFDPPETGDDFETQMVSRPPPGPPPRG